MSLRKTINKVFDENFCYTKFPLIDPDLIQSDMRLADKILEQQLRICDTKEYMDTLTLNTTLLETPQLFFYIMV
jgi:hypothetical protein